MKHFNRGIVKGKLVKIRHKGQDTEKPYLRLELDCPGKYGNVKAFGAVFGKEKVRQFLSELRKEDMVALTGFLSQYEKAGVIKTSFTFIKGELWDKDLDQHRYMRATFILVGEVMAIKDQGDEPVATIRVRNHSKEEHYTDLVVHIPPQLLFDVEKGKVQRLTGHLKQDEDDVGDVITMTRPLIETVTTVGE